MVAIIHNKDICERAIYLYTKNKISVQAVADELGFSRFTISTILKNYGVDIRSAAKQVIINNEMKQPIMIRRPVTTTNLTEDS